MPKDKEKLPEWLASVGDGVKKQMFAYKLEPSHKRQSLLDTIAQEAIIRSKRATCLFYEVAAVLFHPKKYVIFSNGYNGPVSGDVDPRDVGCARIVNGKIEKGKGKCRGTHAEANVIDNHCSNTPLDELEMMVTLHPCFECSQKIIDSGIKKIYYIWEYGRDSQAISLLKDAGVEVIKYESDFLSRWINLNGYHSVGEMHNLFESESNSVGLTE